MAPGDLRRIVREQAGELRIEEIGVARPRAVVHQGPDHLDAMLAQMLEPLVVPGKVELAWSFRSNRLPQDRVANRLDAELDHRVEVAEARVMTGVDQLVAIVVADPDDRTFDPAPQLER